MTALVIGYGNTLRGDDGVGYRVAEAVESWGLAGVEAHPCHQLTPELAAAIAPVDTVIFVDAAMPQNPCSPVMIERITAETPSPSFSPHHSTPKLLMALAQSLYGRAPVAYSLILPTREFGYGEVLSPIAASGMQQALNRIRELI